MELTADIMHIYGLDQSRRIRARNVGEHLFSCGPVTDFRCASLIFFFKDPSSMDAPRFEKIYDVNSDPSVNQSLSSWTCVASLTNREHLLFCAARWKLRHKMEVKGYKY